jgi:putative ABC transport system ATP-binding protein
MGTNTGPIITCEGVSKIYHIGNQNVSALRDITLSFDSGSFWAIMGTSGSGKSTLLNMLGCLDRPTSGHYLFAGQDVSTLDDNGMSELRLRMLGFIFQSFNLIPQLTVQENIELPLFYQGYSASDSRSKAKLLADKVGLASRLDHKPMELSGGQQQRVAIARALANDPAVLLADEPTGNLDSATSTQIMQLLLDLNRQGKTIIMVTHEPDVATYAQYRLIMQDGRIAGIED